MPLDVAVFFAGPNYDKTIPAVGITVVVRQNLTPLPPGVTAKTDATGMAHFNVVDGNYVVVAEYQGSTTGGPIVSVSGGNGFGAIYLPFDPPNNNLLLIAVGAGVALGAILYVARR